jgi:hypothetical protein
MPIRLSALCDVSADIEAEVFDRRIVAVGVDACNNAGLDTLAHGPVLPVDEIPEIDCVGRVEVRLGHFVRMEQEAALDERWRSARHRPQSTKAAACSQATLSMRLG